MSFDPLKFVEKALEALDNMSDEEFEQKARERCPELFEDPGPPPANAMIPENFAHLVEEDNDKVEIILYVSQMVGLKKALEEKKHIIFTAASLNNDGTSEHYRLDKDFVAKIEKLEK